MKSKLVLLVLVVFAGGLLVGRQIASGKQPTSGIRPTPVATSCTQMLKAAGIKAEASSVQPPSTDGRTPASYGVSARLLSGSFVRCGNELRQETPCESADVAWTRRHRTSIPQAGAPGFQEHRDAQGFMMQRRAWEQDGERYACEERLRP